jgi:Uma2 family endonuclease
MTTEEYLRIERAAEWKSDYLDGKMLPWPPVTALHVLITTNVGCEIHDQLREGPCNAYMSALRVTTDPRRHYTYPDVVVACDPLQFVDEHKDTITNPILVAEVLSDATEAYDRGVKAERYRAVPTLAEYLFVSQERVHIELYTRRPDGAWSFREWNDPHAEIDLASVGCRLKIAEVYAKVELDSADSSTT